MAHPQFCDKNCVPDEELLKQTTGNSYFCLVQMRTHVVGSYGSTTEEWKFYGQKYGWQLKTFLKKRNLFFIIPDESSFKLVFIFGDRAVKVIEESDISENLKQTVIGAKKYAEGRGLSIDIYDDTDIEDIKNLIDIKVNN